ncbi:MAG: Gldg family protein [Anaerolineales bacterium]|nr:Gldg family protein [Anaerolineales bacterium]
MPRSIYRIARKELAAFFSSPAAFIFFGSFLAVTLFIFFWVETFFARNIADVRPLFEWMPILMIFLVASLTMKMWSEEKRMGTLEVLLTSSVNPLHLILGKFLACLILVGLALLLTLSVPLTVSVIGGLDWGPVFAGYTATLFLAAAYAAIGLYVSSKSDNQIVSLIATVLVCGLLYLVGSDTLTSLFGNRASEILKLAGSGSRFQSITRGVIDLRDLYYYLSIAGIFISLNAFALEKLRWSSESKHPGHRRWRLATILFAANFLIGNLWLSHVAWARVDVTRGRIYSISDATRGYLRQIQEPLLIRGYFSAKTHPLLAPLVPQLRDLILEYQVAGRGKVRAEFIDPLKNPELEKEASEKYGIKPVPLQVTDKYQASLVNSYFNVLIKYGDQYEVLGFRDLIEVNARKEMQLDVKLRNPEYDITRSIKKVLYSYQGAGDLFAGIKHPVRFNGYISPDEELPEVLAEFKGEVNALLEEMKGTSNGRLDYAIKDPRAQGGTVAKFIAESYGFHPMRVGLFDPRSFYFYMTLESDRKIVIVPLPEDLNKEALRRGVEAALKRFSASFLKTIALYTPPSPPVNPYMRRLGMGGGGKQFELLREKLGQTHNFAAADLQKGRIPDDADLLVVAAPEKFSDKQLFAMDQFLMKGGTVILLTSPFSVSLTRTSLSASKHDSGLEGWLEHNGIALEESLVLDPQNEQMAIPVARRLGGFIIQELRMVEYPYFVDVRAKGMAGENSLTSGLSQVTLNWASPIVVDEKKNEGRKVTPLLKSSPKSWTSRSTDVLPDYRLYERLGFGPADDNRAEQTLAVAVEGRFESFYKGKKSPFLNETETKIEKDAKDKDDEGWVMTSVIERSPESARIILFASNEFLTDETLNRSTMGGSERYLNSLQLLENAVDWSLEDRGLLTIRGRGRFSKNLPPLSRNKQLFWEYLNYALALAGLAAVFFLHRVRQRWAMRRYDAILRLERT